MPFRPRHRVRSLSDESLLAGLGVGEVDAELAFVRRFQPRVFGLALTILGDAQAAEDVAQEALVRAWRHADAYDARRGSVATWLLTITRNLAIDALRMRRTTNADPQVLAAVDVEPLWTMPVRQASVDSLAVRDAILTIPEEQRRAVLLAWYFGYTARDISEMEGIPIGTAKTRIRAGLLKIRAALDLPEDAVDDSGSPPS